MASQKKSSAISRWLIRLTLLSLLAAVLGIAAMFTAYKHYENQLPGIEQLRDVKFQIPLRIYSKDNKLIAQFGEKKRIPASYEQTPPLMVKAFLAAEDDRFFEHPGVDYQGLLRAAVQLVLTGEKRQGGSTITMQVARNFFLSSEKTYLRKIKEIFLALKIEHELSKEEILELYLNKIYLGHRSYGIGAAAQVYYGKSLDELSLAQIAMIAGLPKAPSSYNPITNQTRAHQRRDYVLGRMFELEHISQQDYVSALNEPITAKLHGASIELDAPYIAEMARDFMFERYGEDAYTSGFRVLTTVDSRLQKTAQTALKKALHDYDGRHGYRGVENHLDKIPEGILELNQFLKSITKVGDTIPAIVISTSENKAEVYSESSGLIELDIKDLDWARKFLTVYSRGPTPRKASDLFEAGDIIRLTKNSEEEKWELSQIPEVQGAFVALSPETGAIISLVGGFDYYASKYNRAIQTKRQPGSGFKPILYTTALENGFTPASIINDAPVVLEGNEADSDWRPENYSGKFFGPTRLRVALRKSRNLVSIRLLRELGVSTVIESAKRFGFTEEQLPNSLSLALGSGTASPMQMARVFATFANGGYLITPYLIDRIEENNGATVWKNVPTRVCPECLESMPANPEFNVAPRVIAPDIHFLMNSLLQDVVKNGTAVKAKQLGRSDLAGKTGTTNEQRDAWFNGYCRNLVATAWVGLDNSKPLGARETGGQAALPMWIDYMSVALEGVPERQFERPDNINMVRIDSQTGRLAGADTPDAIFEYFREENTPESFTQPETDTSPFRNNNYKAPDIDSLF